MYIPTKDIDGQLGNYKLLAYRIIVPIATVAIAIYWYISCLTGETDPFTMISYPVILAIFGSATTLLFIYPRSINWLETIGFYTFTVYIILGMYFTLRVTEPDIADLAIFGLWFPFIFVITFSMMPQRSAVINALIIYILIVIPGIHSMANNGIDFWNKPVNIYLMTFYIAIGIYIPILYGINVLRRTYQMVSLRATKLSRDAEIDSLTNIANRRALDQEFSRSFALVQRHQRPLSIIMFDIDRFKRINDTYGHSIGDTVLIMIARTASEELRSSDIFGRWGGEEFMIISPESDLDTTLQIAERVRLKIAAQPILKDEIITASFGVASFQPGDSIETLVKRADSALYHAKAAGRNRVESTSTNADKQT